MLGLNAHATTVQQLFVGFFLSFYSNQGIQKLKNHTQIIRKLAEESELQSRYGKIKTVTLAPEEAEVEDGKFNEILSENNKKSGASRWIRE